MPEPDLTETITPPAFAARVGLNDQTIRAMIVRGEIHAFRVGSRFKIPLSELTRVHAKWAEPYGAPSA